MANMILIFSIAVALLVLTLLILFIVSPTDRMHPDVKLLRGKYIAHRGLHDKENQIPENSLAAFQRAVEMGFPIEIDIHLTRDGEVVVFHDRNTKRVTGVDCRIEETDLKELRNLRLFGTREKIPTLQEVLDLVDGKVFLLIEFKMVDGNTKELCEAADEILSQYEGLYFVQSFYPQVLRWYKKNRKKICRGLLAARFSKRDNPKKTRKQLFPRQMAGRMMFNFLARPDFISYKHEDAKCLMRRFAVWLGAESVGWTFCSEKDVAKRKKHFHTFIFENFIPSEEEE